jgi:cell division septation protein DedD
MPEDDFHEIQLNGKQLVFLFMSATVVAVVIFLCGVMVGRGVRAPRTADQIEASADSGIDPTAGAQPAPVAASPDGTPAAAGETLTYPDRLEDPTPPPETLVDPTAKPAATKATAAAPAAPAAAKTTPAPAAQTPAPAPVAPKTPAAVPASTTDAKSAPVASEPAGNGYVVQVAATRSRSEADTIARRLSAKGYPTFVTTGAANMFRVRVGKYPDRRQAESIAQKLQKEEQFKPWITR